MQPSKTVTSLGPGDAVFLPPPKLLLYRVYLCDRGPSGECINPIPAGPITHVREVRRYTEIQREGESMDNHGTRGNVALTL